MKPLILFLLLLPSFAPAACKHLLDGYCADSLATIEVTRGKAAKVDLLVAQGTTLKIRMPPGVVLDKSTFTMGSTAYFALTFDDPDAPRSIFIVPVITKGGSLIGHRNNVQFEVAGESVIVNLKVAAEGVQQLTVKFPQLEQEMAQEKDLRASIRAEVEKDLARARANIGKTSKVLARKEVLAAALKRLTCSVERERGLDRALRLTTKRICAFGEWIFIEARLDNQRRKDFELREITVEGLWDDAPKALDFDVRWVTSNNDPAAAPLKLRFEEAVRGMFLITPPQGELPDSYRVTVRERGGLKRVVVADDIEF